MSIKNIFLLTLLVIVIQCNQSEPPSNIQPIAFIHATIVDVENGNLIPDQTILIYENKIGAIGKSGSIEIPSGSKLINATGKFLIPGLWDAHVHLSYLGACALPVLVAYGVTSVRDLGSLLPEIHTWQAMINDGRLIGPRMKATGYNIESGGWLDAATRLMESSETLRKYRFFELAPRLRIDNPADAEKAVDSLIRMGSDVVKFRNLGSTGFFSLARESRRRGMPLVGHAPQELSLAEASNAGMASIEHGETVSNSLANLNSEKKADQFKTLARNQTMITPTLTGDYFSKLSTPEEMKAAITDTAGAIDPRNKFISDKLRTIWQLAYDSRYLNGEQDFRSFFQRSAMHLREAYKATVPMLAGTDLGVILVYPGSSLHEEMALMVEKIGMSPADALQTATMHPAKFFNMQDSLGTIQTGKLADLILLDANPLSDIRNTRRINAVVLNGQYFDKSALNNFLSQAAFRMKKKESCGN